jgi:hypothetical protein
MPWVTPERIDPTTAPSTVRSVSDGVGLQQWHNTYGQLHREDGPAVIRPNGVTEWWQHGQLHRTDGPAYQAPNGFHTWWRRGRILLDTESVLDGLDAATLTTLFDLWSPRQNIAELVRAIEAARH